MQRISLRLRIMLITSILVVAVVGSALLILNWVVKRQVGESIEQVSKRTNAVFEQTISSYLDRLEVETALLADRPGTTSIYLADSATVSNHLNELQELIGADWLVLTDAFGTVIGISDRAPFALYDDNAQHELVASAIDNAGWKGVLASGDSAALVATQPVVVRRFVQATLTTGKNIDAAMLNEIAEAAQVEMAIYSDSGLIVSTASFSGMATESNGIRQVQIGSQTYVGSMSVVPGSIAGASLQFLALSPESVITGPFQPLRRSLIALLLFGLIASIVAGAWLAHSVTRPLNGLMDAARTLQAGQWPAPFKSERKDEIGFLQNHFDEMTMSLREGRERLVAMLDIDPLTELWNHRCFKGILQRELDVQLESGGQLSMILLDIDNFEAYNRDRGADKGDQALVKIARIVSAKGSKNGIAGRYGGNVFCVMTFQGDPGQLAEDIRSAIENLTELTCSVGTSSVGESTRRADLLLLAAEIAVGQAKSAGRNIVQPFKGFELSPDDDILRRMLRGGSYAVVHALAEAVDAKDPYTHGHSQRVAESARSLAEARGLDPGFVELVYITGTLHDVGKIGVPDEVLKKTSSLTEEEYAKIKLHPELGEKIVAQVPELRETLPGIRNHHERYDGGGYPDRLSREDIPLIARILAVADAYDAMTSDRPYRKGMSAEQALDIIELEAGRQFDPALARTFIEISKLRLTAA